MDKGGVSHIEAILSFLLFIGFIFFGLYFFSPTGNTNLIDSSLQYTLIAVSENTSVELMAYSVKINRQAMGTQQSVAIEFPPEVTPIPPTYKVRAETYEGVTLPATRSGDIVYVNPGANDFAVIKFSEDLPDSQPATQSPALNRSMYQIASSSTRYVISEKRLLELNNSYYQDYDSLKNDLSLPGQTAFGYSFQVGNRIISGPALAPVGVDVYSTIARREILKTTGETIFGEVNIRVW